MAALQRIFRLLGNAVQPRSFINGSHIMALSAAGVQTEALDMSKKRPLEDTESECQEVKRVCTSAETKEVSENANDDTKKVGSTSSAERIKRKKVAVLLAYSGQGYLGMQRNPERKTIEEDILVAMKAIDAITEEAYTFPQSVHFQRAARTDKGVSAARQVISLKLPLYDGIVSKLNAHLPSQIRVLSIKRVTKGFNSKTSCDARTYTYMLPTFAFAPVTEIVTEEYRISKDVLEEVRQTLKAFEGTHNFHNFTSRKKPLDPSAQRYIMSFECGEPFEKDGLEFAVLKVKGQSFMLHQIRKMVGITTAIARGLASFDVLKKSWQPVRIDIPRAPGLGLVLDEVHYDKYNKRFGSDGMHDTLDWKDVEEETQRFKEEHIYPSIVETEKTEKSMFEWLATLPNHSYDVRDYEIAPGERSVFGKAAALVAKEDSSENEEDDDDEEEGPEDLSKEPVNGGSGDGFKNKIVAS